jgi:hypothetical protein
LRRGDRLEVTQLERSKRHHFLPQLLLRAFSNDDMLATFDRDSGRTFIQPITTAAAENDYNTLLLADGSRSDMAERAIAEAVEGPAAQLVEGLRNGRPPANAAERDVLARFVTFQFLRVPAIRHQIDALSDHMMKLDMAAGGPQKLRTVLATELGREPTDDEVREHWDAVRDFDDWKLRMPREYHVRETLQMLDEFSPVLSRGYGWNVIVWKRRHLLTSDTPLILLRSLRATDMPAGLATAGSIYLSLSRSAALMLSNLADAPGVDGLVLPGNFRDSRTINQLTASASHRWVYWHPEDTLHDLLGEGWELPPRPPVTFEDEHSIELRDRLKMMGEWAFDNPDQSHPLGGDSSFAPPWRTGATTNEPDD